MRTKLDKLLNDSIGQHGFWLVNHKSIIAGDLLELLDKENYQNAYLILNNIHSDFTQMIYKKIEETKKYEVYHN